MESIVKNAIIVLSIATLLFAAYYFYTQQNLSVNFQANDRMLGELRAQAQVFVERRQVLDDILLDTQVLSESRFTQLRAFTGPVQPVPLGRANPFLPTVGTPNQTASSDTQ